MGNYEVLRAEVINDPLARGYGPMSPEEVASDLNTLYRTRTQPLVPLAALAIWAAKSGVRARIEAHATNPSSPVQSVCLTLRDLLTGLGGPPLDLGNLDNQTMLTGLVTVGVLTTDNRDSLLSLTVFAISRAVELAGWGVPVDAPDITFVRSS